MERMEADFQRMLLENPNFFDDDEDEEPPRPVKIQEFYVSPGTGIDCDDCGYTPDTLRVDVYDDGIYDVNAMLGCTGGGGFRTTDISQVREFAKRFAQFFEKENEYKALLKYLDSQEKI